MEGYLQQAAGTDGGRQHIMDQKKIPRRVWRLKWCADMTVNFQRQWKGTYNKLYKPLAIGTQCLAHSKMFDKSIPYVLENDWKSVANSQRRYVFTVLYMISIIGIH